MCFVSGVWSHGLLQNEMCRWCPSRCPHHSGFFSLGVILASTALFCLQSRGATPSTPKVDAVCSVDLPEVRHPSRRPFWREDRTLGAKNCGRLFPFCRFSSALTPCPSTITRFDNRHGILQQRSLVCTVWFGKLAGGVLLRMGEKQLGFSLRALPTQAWEWG